MIDGVHSQHFFGTSVLVHLTPTLGLLVVDRNTVAVSVSDIQLSFCAYPVELPGEVSLTRGTPCLPERQARGTPCQNHRPGCAVTSTGLLVQHREGQPSLGCQMARPPCAVCRMLETV